MVVLIPLLALPLLIYNFFYFGDQIGIRFLVTGGGERFSETLLTVPMLSGAEWVYTGADALISLALFLLFVELIEATRIGTFALFDHILSTFVFIAYLVQFLIVEEAATSLFFVLMSISFLDVIGGFSISIRTARRDVAIAP